MQSVRIGLTNGLAIYLSGGQSRGLLIDFNYYFSAGTKQENQVLKRRRNIQAMLQITLAENPVERSFS